MSWYQRSKCKYMMQQWQIITNNALHSCTERICHNIRYSGGTTNGDVARLRKYLLLLAVSQGYVLTLLPTLEQNAESEEVWNDLRSLLYDVFNPVGNFGGPTLTWNSHKFDKQMQNRDAESKTIGRKGIEIKESHSRLQFSPNVLSLFVETRVSLTSPTVVVMSPYVNCRKLLRQRVWDEKALGTNNNPGVIGSMLGLGVGETGRDTSLCHLEYHIFPYKIKEGIPSTADSEDVLSEGIFSHQQHRNAEDGDRIVTHITTDDVRQLLEVLSSKVCNIIEYVVRNEYTLILDLLSCV